MVISSYQGAKVMSLYQGRNLFHRHCERAVLCGTHQHILKTRLSLHHTLPSKIIIFCLEEVCKIYFTLRPTCHILLPLLAPQSSSTLPLRRHLSLLSFRARSLRPCAMLLCCCRRSFTRTWCSPPPGRRPVSRAFTSLGLSPAASKGKKEEG